MLCIFIVRLVARCEGLLSRLKFILQTLISLWRSLVKVAVSTLDSGCFSSLCIHDPLICCIEFISLVSALTLTAVISIPVTEQVWCPLVISLALFVKRHGLCISHLAQV